MVERLVEVKSLHLGCGNRRMEGFVNVDSRPNVNPDVVADISRLDQHFPENSADIIYAAHVVEHFTMNQAIAMLDSWKRVLIPHCPLRLSVPDFKILSDLYASGVSMWRISGPLVGRGDYPENRHGEVYDHEKLAWVMGQAGFYNIKTWDPQAFLPHGYDDYSLARIEGRLISLCLEGKAAP